MKLLAYLFFIIFSFQFCSSQTHIYKHFGVDEGLPSSEVYDIYQDKQGYIWFATDKGLSRYNGYEFTTYTTKDGLPGNTILDFYPQEDGRIFCYEYHTQNLFYFNDTFDGFTMYKYNGILKDQLDYTSILKSIVIDEDNALFAGGFSHKGYIKINKEGIAKKFFSLDSYNKIKEVEDGINLGFFKNAKLFFYVNHNYQPQKDVTFLNIKKGISSRMDFVFLNENQILFIDKKLGIINKKNDVAYYDSKQYPIGLKKINNSSFFVGYYSNGGEIRNSKGDVIQRFLPNKSVSNFLIDAEGGYWFSTLDDGVFYIKNPDLKTFSDKHVSSLVKNNNNTLYLGYKNGNIGRLNNKSIETIYTGVNSDAALVEFDKNENILYGFSDRYLKDYTLKEKSFYLTANKLPEHIEDGFIASATHFYYERVKNNIINHHSDLKIQDVCFYNTSLLIATSSGLFVKKNENIKPYQPVDILKHRIDDIDLNKNTNTVYMATQGAGMIVYGDSIYNITKEHGLTNDIVSEVHIENDSTVWACTNSGLNRITFQSNNRLHVATITKNDGLLSNDIDDVEITNDTVWVATKKGLCYFRKDILSKKEASNIISLSLNEVIVNNKSINTNNIKLKYNQNNIEFKIQAISHKNTDNINYLYRLKEVDSSWSTTKNRTINFPSLSPGNYTFEAKANVYNNPNNLITRYTFKILPPYWKSWWFYGLCFLLFSGLIYLFFRVRVLTYNQDVFRELIRLVIKRLKRKEQVYRFRSNGEDFKIPTHEILYINSQGNYLDIVAKQKTYTIRCKIGNFIKTTPDALEYLRLHRSYIIRIDQVSSKGKNWVVIKDQKIPVGETYLSELEKIQF